MKASGSIRQPMSVYGPCCGTLQARSVAGQGTGAGFAVPAGSSTHLPVAGAEAWSVRPGRGPQIRAGV